MSSEFYTLNHAQHFMFPHDNCDTYTNAQLEALAFGSDHLVEFLTNSLKSPVKHYDLRHIPEFVVLVVSYLRLKFMLEVLDPPRLQGRLAQIPKRLAILGSPWLDEGVLDEQPLPRGEGTSSSSLRLEETRPDIGAPQPYGMDPNTPMGAYPINAPRFETTGEENTYNYRPGPTMGMNEFQRYGPDLNKGKNEVFKYYN